MWYVVSIIYILYYILNFSSMHVQWIINNLAILSEMMYSSYCRFDRYIPKRSVPVLLYIEFSTISLLLTVRRR